VELDASVILRWLLADPGRERDTERATVLVQAVVAGELEILQPFHWLAEVAAVLARLSPETATDDTLMLSAMEIPTTDEVQVLGRACTLAIDMQHHLFDTLYHAWRQDRIGCRFSDPRHVTTIWEINHEKAANAAMPCAELGLGQHRV
jgi:hypothetical protein